MTRVPGVFPSMQLPSQDRMAQAAKAPRIARLAESPESPESPESVESEESAAKSPKALGDPVVFAGERRTPSPRPRRYWPWWMGAGAVILLLALLPPLINANRYQRQIARSMSLSLGRPVHLDNVSFHLLPVPGLTLSNLVVSEEPAFGAEPTIRANTVEASLRLSSLWRRRVEFSRVRFVEPSVNLVRNGEGRWNLADVLLHAAHVNTAPTAQRRAGPAPRFPYIEATGGRVNVKLGEEKLPFSLTAADFALWQPSPHQWRVRLRGQPDRTDVNMTDPGSLRIEGDLLQATAAEDVRVNLHADWYDAPLGEATLLLTGGDLGWRGRLNLEASLAGTLDAARLEGKLTLGALRRADFAPAHPLDLQGTCSAGLSIQTARLKQLACSLPDGAPEPIRLGAAEIDLQHPEQTQATLVGEAVPNRWALLWAALFSPRISAETVPPGTLDLQFTRLGEPGAADPAPSRKRRGTRVYSAALEVARSAWKGSLTVHLPQAAAAVSPEGAAVAPASPVAMVFQSAFNEASPAANPNVRPLFRLEPTALHPDAASTFQVDGFISTAGYSFDVAGVADRAALLLPVHFLPELGDGGDAVLPPASESGSAVPVDFTCGAAWGTAQLCAPLPNASSLHHALPSPNAPPLPKKRAGAGALRSR